VLDALQEVRARRILRRDTPERIELAEPWRGIADRTVDMLATDLPTASTNTSGLSLERFGVHGNRNSGDPGIDQSAGAAVR
jgi:hypothetical protein